jgi:hypothetical protein
MFQFNYKLKVSERVRAKCNRHPRYNPSGTDAAELGVDAPLAFLFLTCIRRGYRSTPHTESFLEGRCLGRGFVRPGPNRSRSNVINPRGRIKALRSGVAFAALIS